MSTIRTRTGLDLLLARIKRRSTFFGATVVKRQTGAEREFNATPIGDSLNDYDSERDLLTAYDNMAGGIRSINVPGIQEIRAFGRTYRVDLS